MCPSCGAHPYGDLSAPDEKVEGDASGSTNTDQEEVDNTEEDTEVELDVATQSSNVPQPHVETSSKSAQVPASTNADAPSAPEIEAAISAASTPTTTSIPSLTVQDTQAATPSTTTMTAPVTAVAQTTGEYTGVREKELLYFAYALLVVILGIVARRAFVSFVTI